jgi:hypothetical protein
MNIGPTNAHNIVLDDERHAVQQVEVSPTNQEVKDNFASARVAGTFFLNSPIDVRYSPDTLCRRLRIPEILTMLLLGSANGTAITCCVRVRSISFLRCQASQFLDPA